ncbi:MAG: [LysW]-lysine hydrolase [Planctomycetes bacterium]|nr:[LysW]-lysine hydrolase [Planctomycetota bacterium]
MDAVEFLTALVATPSVSGDEAAAAELCVARMSALGLDAHVDGAGNAVGVARGAEVDGARRTLVLLGHIDTVPGDIPVRVTDGVLHGRGSVDAKGPFATFVEAVGGLAPAPGVDLVVIGAVEEECPTSKGARYAAERYAPEACVIGEPSGWDALTLGYKGRLLARVALTQPCGHGAGEQGSLAEVAVALWNAVRAWCDAFNAEREALFDRCLPALERFVTSSDGLHDRVDLRLGFRLPPDFDTAGLRARLVALAAPHAVRCEGEEVAWSSPRTSPLARAFTRAFAEHGLRPRFKHKTGTADLNVLGPRWGCPIAAYGPGDSSLDHTPEERLELAEYARAIEVLRAALVHGGWAAGPRLDAGAAIR